MSTKFTMLITNDLNIYKKVYKIFKVSTSLIANDLNVYVNVKVFFRSDVVLSMNRQRILAIEQFSLTHK